MKQLCLILTLSLVSILGFSQINGDTVVIYVDNRVEITVASEDFTQLQTNNLIQSALAEFNKLIPQFSAKLASDKPEHINYSVGNTLTVEPGNPANVFLMKEGKLSDTGFRDQAVIKGENFTISIITADISKVPDMALVNCMEQVSAVLPEKIRWSKSIYYECIDNKVVLIEEKNNEMDMLELSLGAGAGLVKNTWVPDLSFGLSLRLNHKGAPQGPGISSNFIFDFAGETGINVNTFLNLNYSWTINKKAKKPDMLSFEMGYLISRQGELFGENTLKLAFSWSPAKFVTVSPQLYISDNFGQAFPGIRVGFGF